MRLEIQSSAPVKEKSLKVLIKQNLTTERFNHRTGRQRKFSKEGSRQGTADDGDISFFKTAVMIIFDKAFNLAS